MKVSLRYKLLTAFISILIIPLAVATTVFMTTFSEKLNDRQQQEMASTVTTAEAIFEDLSGMAAPYINLLAGEEYLRQALIENDRGKAIRGMANFYSKARLSGVSFLEVGDVKGKVFISANNMRKFGEDNSSNPLIKKALQGEMVGSPQIGTMGMTYVSTGPIKDSEGKVIGTVTAGFTLDNSIVDKIKYITGAEIAIFQHSRCIASTIIKDKERQVDYTLESKEINQVVLGEGKILSGQSELFSEPVSVAYNPIKSIDGKTLGMLMVSKSRKEIIDAQMGTMKKLTLVIAVALIIVIIITIFASNIALAPLLKLVQGTESLAKGELDHQVKINSGDEIGNLGQAFDKMVTNWREIVTRLNNTASQVTSSSEQLSSAANQTSSSSESIATTVVQLASGADNQAKSVQATATTIEEMAANLANVANHARDVATASSEALEVARGGGKVVGVVTTKMKDIKINVDKSAQTIHQLVNRSKEIEEIISVITGISEETNLLALNAAIEAAHAGEHGRGFAVVAGEVRKLAEQSGRSAEAIAHLIREMQRETKEAMVAMEEGTKEVAYGVEAAGQAGQAFHQIIQVVENISGQVAEVSTAVEQMNSGSSQIVESINQVAEIASEVAQGSEQVSTAAEEQMASMEEIASLANLLAKMAEELKAIVKLFKL